VVPPRGGLGFLDELVGRSPTVFTTLGTQSSLPKLKRGRKSRNGNEEMRTVRLRLLPNGAQERRLRKLADVTARLWNELNYVRLMQYRASGKIDFKGTEHEFYHKYNSVLGANAGQVVRLNNSAWKSFFETLRLYRQGKLPRFNGKPSPPGFWKDRLLGKRRFNHFSEERQILP
jgi:transposase